MAHMRAGFDRLHDFAAVVAVTICVCVGVTESRYGSCLLIAADGAGLSFHAGFCTGRLSGDNVFTVGVTESGNFFLCGQYFAADRAVTALGESGFGTSSVNCGVSDRCVTESRNEIILISITANGAGIGCIAFFCAGRFSYN